MNYIYMGAQSERNNSVCEHDHDKTKTTFTTYNSGNAKEIYHIFPSESPRAARVNKVFILSFDKLIFFPRI